MPSPVHELLVSLFRQRASFAAEALRDVLGVAVPPFAEARIEDKGFPQVLAERRADQVIVLRDGKKPVFGVVVEVQLRRDEKKREAWPLYAAALRARIQAPVCTLVLCTGAAVARWAAEPIEIGPGSVFTPRVLGPTTIPVVTDPAAAVRGPELACLSLFAHHRGRDAGRIAAALLDAASRLDDPRAGLYTDLVHLLAEKFGMKIEDLLSEDYQPSERAKRTIALLRQAREEGRQEGREEGREEGQELGRQEGQELGRQEGRAAGRAEMLLAFLERRGLEVNEAQRERILACTDPEKLDRWLDHAVAASDVEDVLR